MPLPLIGRLKAQEWPYLILSLVLVTLEHILSFLIYYFPGSLIEWFRATTNSILSSYTAKQEEDDEANRPELPKLIDELGKASGFVEMCQLFGYESEEHIVKTSDGYLLGIHRIGGPKGTNWRSRSTEDQYEYQQQLKPVVYLHHGLLMNSEVWICNLDPAKSLPFVLADMGYDVWLGNNRGNKYSKKHLWKQPNTVEFWNFSMDDFALYDIPDTIDYILNLVEQEDLVYIGFSQGSAQAFAALSINPQLNHKVRLFIALAPAMAPPRLENRIVNALACSSPSIMYLFFGRKSILGSAAFWQSMILPALYVKVIDLSLLSLFRWYCKNISHAQKLVSYQHLYSYTSTKSVVHWFQIIRSGRFHMYDDDLHSPIAPRQSFYRVSPFPTQNIMTPIVLIYGDTDSLVDIDVMLSALPRDTVHIGVRGYEHLDLLWGDDIDSLVFPYIFSALRRINVKSPKSLARTVGDASTAGSPMGSPMGSPKVERRLSITNTKSRSRRNTLTNSVVFASANANL